MFVFLEVEGRELTLQIGQLLLGGIFACYHVLYDVVHSVENHLIVTQGQHRVDLGVQQTVTVLTQT